MSIEDLPKPIKDEIVRVTSRSIYAPENERLHITELCGCLREAWFRRKTSGDRNPSMQQRWWFYRGILFDNAWTRLFSLNQTRVTHRHPKPEIPVTVIGRLDFIDEDGAVADLKTTASLGPIQDKGPKSEHVKQVLFYAYCDCRTKARLYYVSLLDAMKVDVPVTIAETDRIMTEVDRDAEMLYLALLTDKPPPRDDTRFNGSSNWKCRECEFKERCKNE